MQDHNASKPAETTTTPATPAAAPVAGAPTVPVAENAAATEPAPSPDQQKTNASNTAAERKALMQRFVEQKLNFKGTGSGSELLASAGRFLVQRLKELREELKAFDKQKHLAGAKPLTANNAYPAAGAANMSGGTVEVTDTTKQVEAAKKLDALIAILQPPDKALSNIKAWELASENELGSGKGLKFDETLVAAIQEFRDATGQPYVPADSKTGVQQDTLSRLEDFAKLSVENSHNVEKIVEAAEQNAAQEAAEKAALQEVVPVTPGRNS